MPALRPAAPSSKATTCCMAPDDDHVAGTAEDAQRDLVRHHAGGDEDRGGLADERGVGLLELDDGRVLAVAVVADVASAIARRIASVGLRDGVAPQVHGARHAAMLQVGLVTAFT